MGRPAQIASRQSGEEGGQASTSAPETSTNSTHAADPAEPPPVKIPLGETPSRARQNQANFLERLIAIKAKKGEKDNVTVYAQKVNQGSGWRTQRKASEAFEDDNGEDDPAPKQSTRERGTGGRPRGSRRTKGPRTAKGGLFRDYRPQLWDTPGADIRAGSSSTPESWNQFEEGRASDGRPTPRSTTNASASPAPTDFQPPQPATETPGPLSTSTRAIASPTPPSPSSLVQSTNIQDTSPIENAAPSPSSLAPAPEPQLPAIETQDSEAAAAAASEGVPDVEMEDS